MIFFVLSNSLHDLGHAISSSGGKRTDECSLDRTQDGPTASEMALDVAEEEEGHQRDPDRYQHRPLRNGNKHVGQERNQATNNVRERDCECTLQCPLGVRLL